MHHLRTNFGLAFLFLTMASVLSSRAFAEEVTFTQNVHKGILTQSFWILRAEEERFIVEAYQQPFGSLQELIARDYFSNQKQARRFYEAKTRGLDSSGRQEFQVSTEVPNRSLWQVRQEWSWEWELRFKEWIDTIDDRDFLAKHDIATDCADVPISFRWIFARINGLPMALRLAGTGAVFSHESIRANWLSLPTANEWYLDQRFLASLNYLLDNTYTETLQRDSYPVQISPESILHGGIFLHMGTSSNHARLLKNIYPYGIGTWNATVPRSTRSLFVDDLYTSEEDFSALKKGAFRRFRWPKKTQARGGWTLVGETAMPYFSEEQYAADFTDGAGTHDNAWKKRLFPGFNPRPQTVLDDLIKKISADIETRKQVVSQGHLACFPNLCPLGSDLYEAHSTPSRDRRILNKILAAVKIVSENKNDWILQWRWKQDLRQTRFRIDGLGIQLRLKNIIDGFQAGRMGSDPNLPIEKRWGL